MYKAINCMEQNVHLANQDIPRPLRNPNFHYNVPTSLTLGPIQAPELLR
jgi:hypothetical protein